MIAAGGTVNLSQLTIRKGSAAQGGGIASDAAVLTLTHVTVTANTATPPTNATAGTPAARAAESTSRPAR